METSSYFIPNKALFGSMPNQHRAEILEGLGVVYFVDLTSPRDTYLSQYHTKHTKINFPIQDRKIPRDLVSFSKFVYQLYRILKQLKDGEKMYIHCKGGHGRSGIVVACLLSLYLKIPPEYSLDLTKYYHQQRKEMRDKWRKIGSPQTFLQKNVVIKLFNPIYFNTKMNAFLSNICTLKIPISINNTTFETVESAYQSMKNPDDIEYIRLLKSCKTLKEMKTLGKSVKLRNDWLEVREKIMYDLIRIKFDQDPELKNKLINTYLSPIVYLSKQKSFWRDRQHNRLGKILQRIRNEFLLSDLN